MDWKDVGKAVKKFAPVLGTVIGGPAGGAVGGAISMVAGALGIESDDPQPDQNVQAIAQHPDSPSKLKQIEIENKTELQRLALESDRMYLQDTQSARQRQVASEKATGKRDVNLYFLAWLQMLGFFTLMAVMFFQAVPKDSSGVVFMLFGALAAGYGQVMQYFFGSSKSDADKNKAMIQNGNGKK